MSDTSIEIIVDGERVCAEPGMTVAVALMQAGIACRISVNGEPRGPLCGMGICFDCAATVDGTPLSRTCQIACRAGMQVHPR